jgi:TolB protein
MTLSLDFRPLRAQALPIVLVLTAVALSGGCGGEESSKRAGVSDPSSSEIVFTVHKDGWNEIWVMDDDGSKRRRLTDPKPSGSSAAGNLSPVWSPQGDRIAFVGSGDATDRDENLLELYVMDVESGETRQLTENSARDADPTWSPDGKRIVFVRADYWATDNVETSHRVIGADGSGEETLVQTDQQVFLGSPSWSPDGNRIAYSRASFAGQRLELTLHVMRSDGSNAMQIAKQAAQPAWSPDGKRIAFVSIADQLGEIYVADANGRNAKRLTKSKEANDTAPAWSPDGKQIIFSSDRSNPQQDEIELYVMPASGGDPKRLTRNEVADLDPDWR